MSGKIFVHIGLPKTATTSLQADFFPEISGEDIEYVGMYQPFGFTNQSDLYNQFSSAVGSGAGIVELRNRLDIILGTGKSLIISDETFVVSDETFVVSSNNASWREKLQNLYSVLQGKDYLLLLTVREPVSATFSFYTNFYPQFKNSFDNFMDCALNDENMQIYHYKKLTDEIFLNFDKKRVFAFKFEDVINNRLSELQKIIEPSYNSNNLVTISNQNSRKRNSDFVYTVYNIPIISLIRRNISRSGIINEKTLDRLRGIARPVSRLLDKWVLSIKVPLLSQEEKDRLKLALKDETSALDICFGIKYE